MKRLLLRLGITTAVIVAVLQASNLLGLATADAKIDPGLRRQLGDGSFVYSLRVDLDFPPEYYHLRRLQEIGTVAGVSGDSVRLLQVTPDQVHQLAGLYWVRRIGSLDESSP